MRGVELRNRIGVSPMCQYSCVDGLPTNWHLVHLGARAVGGAGVVIAEASAVVAEGRISPDDAGIWSDAHTAAWEPVAVFIAAQGAVPGIQLAHAGRKASTCAPWKGSGAVPIEEGGWEVVAPSALAYSDDYPQPRTLSLADVQELPALFAAAARRADESGFAFLELHAAHGYLLHQFLSPLSNARDDAYGGSFENRIRLPLDVVRAVRAAWPESKPLAMRVSATDWVDGGWDLEQTVAFARELRVEGVDLVDCSSGGLDRSQEIDVAPGYQVPFAARVRRDAEIPTAAVGLITEFEQAEEIVSGGDADLVFLARALLRDPYWPLHAARALGVELEWPNQYARAKPSVEQPSART